MTDDDRMDRARRIREMREGTRPDEEQADDESPADAAGGGNGATDDPTTDDGAADEGPSDGGAPDAEPEQGAQPAADAETELGSEPAADAGAAPGAAEAAEVDAGAVAEAVAQGEGDGATLQVSAGEVEDVSVDVEELAAQAGIDTGGGAVAEAGETEVAGAVGMAGAAAESGVETQAETRVLEFGLGSERYCLDIEYVEEIVKRDTVTRVPNTPDYVEGVVDLRGQITTILDPKELLDIDAEGQKELIVVFDPEGFEDQGAIGWIVDSVNQVTPVVEDDVNDSPVDEEYINGVVERDEEFVIWTEPGVAIEHATG